MSNCNFAPVLSGVKAATSQELGVVRPDNATVFVDENGVLSSVGGGGGDGISWSPEEQWTGKYWMDGKKVYQKTLQSPINSTKVVIPISDLNIETFVGASGMAFYQTTYQVSLPRAYPDANTCIDIFYEISTKSVIVRNGTAKYRDSYLTIQYTRTDR